MADGNETPSTDKENGHTLSVDLENKIKEVNLNQNSDTSADESIEHKLTQTDHLNKNATNSGKSTLAAQLLKLYPRAMHICQDIYFWEPGNENLEFVPEVNHNNWEKLSAMDMNRMMADIKAWIQKQESGGDNSLPSLLIIEGILIFNHKELTTLFDKKYFLKLDFDTCRKRRLQRTYNPSDPPGYFEKIVWPMYLSNLSDIQQQDDIVFFTCDEKTELSDLLEKMSTDIQNLHPALEIKQSIKHSRQQE
ncbi:nicotinamide riboside kinase 1-like [Gigantopelta aegis]|uniref:nicotinamide riboside kinase 1-like n=1 Tax=Gigantopelta aegis TaxID=1735272 RepID=UPI001B88C245|nr:nicotinamide riboside kinase 1-like [Gigantopelta aegis]